MLNMMNRGFLPYQGPDGGPASMQISPDTTAAGATSNSSYANQSLTPIPFMQPFSQTQDYTQPTMQPFSAQQPQQQPQQQRRGGGQFMQGILNFMARRGIDRFVDPRLQMRMRRSQPQPYGGQFGGQFGGSFAQRTLPVASNFGGGVAANVGGQFGGGMGDFSGVNPYGTTY